MKKPRCKKKFCYTRREVADLAGVTIWVIRRDSREGNLDMGNILDVARYVDEHRGAQVKVTKTKPKAPAAQ